jgi:hypothetical protein
VSNLGSRPIGYAFFYGKTFGAVAEKFPTSAQEMKASYTEAAEAGEKAVVSFFFTQRRRALCPLR